MVCVSRESVRGVRFRSGVLSRFLVEVPALAVPVFPSMAIPLAVERPLGICLRRERRLWLGLQS